MTTMNSSALLEETTQLEMDNPRKEEEELNHNVSTGCDTVTVAITSLLPEYTVKCCKYQEELKIWC